MTFARIQPSSLGGTPLESSASNPGSTQILASASAGDLGVLWINVWTSANTGATFPATYTDSQGNTWNRRPSNVDNQSLSSEATAIYDCVIGTGGNISVNPSTGVTGLGGSVQWEFGAAEYSGPAATPFDISGGASSQASATSLSVSTSTTSATTELGAAAFSSQASGSNIGWGGLGSWTSVYRQNNNNTAQACQFSDFISATLHSTTATATATTTASGTWCGSVAVWKTTGGSGPSASVAAWIG